MQIAAEEISCLKVAAALMLLGHNRPQDSAVRQRLVEAAHEAMLKIVRESAAGGRDGAANYR
jgi:hypothetical protein